MSGEAGELIAEARDVAGLGYSPWHDQWIYKLTDALSQAERDVEALRTKLALIESFCDSHYPDLTGKAEVIARRVLWAIRGSHDEPPHPDRAANPDE